LPQLDQAPLFDQIDPNIEDAGNAASANGSVVDGIVLSSMLCPSSPVCEVKATHGKNIMMPSYVGISGADNDPNSRTDNCCTPLDQGILSASGILIPNAVVKIRDITDGTSNTICVGEASQWSVESNGIRHVNSGGYQAGWQAGTFVPGTPPNFGLSPFPGITITDRPMNLTTIRYAPSSTYGQPGIHETTGVNNPLTSPHAGSVHVLLADGAAKSISENIDLATFKNLANRDDGNVIGEY